MGTGELLGKPNKLRESDLRWTSIRPGGVETLLAASRCKNRDKLWQLHFLDNVVTKFVVNNRTDALKPDINLLFTITNCHI